MITTEQQVQIDSLIALAKDTRGDNLRLVRIVIGRIVCGEEITAAIIRDEAEQLEPGEQNLMAHVMLHTIADALETPYGLTADDCIPTITVRNRGTE